jgi:hypothetical protein
MKQLFINYNNLSYYYYIIKATTTNFIKHILTMTRIKDNIGGLYSQIRNFNSSALLLARKDDLLREIDDLEVRFDNLDGALEDQTQGHVESADDA